MPRPVVGDYYRAVIDGNVIGKSQCYSGQDGFYHIDFVGGSEANGWTVYTYLSASPIWIQCGDTENFDITVPHTLVFEQIDQNPNPNSLGWLEATGPKPGHGVSFGMPCSEEGFHLGFPLTLGNGENEEIAICYHGPKRHGAMIKFRPDNSSDFGDDIIIGGGGAVVIGSGESAENLVTNVNINPGTENTYITSDGNINFYSNCNTIADKRYATFKNSGHMSITSKQMVRGSSTPPSAIMNDAGYAVVDPNGNTLMQLLPRFQTDGRQGGQLEFNGHGVWNGIGLYVDANGNRSVTVHDPAA